MENTVRITSRDFSVIIDEPVVCLCGSTRFKQEFTDANFKFTMDNHIVLTVGFFEHSDKDGHQPTRDEKRMLNRLHKAKIMMSDFIYVINPGGYIGKSTRSEIEFAEMMGIDVRYMVEPQNEHARNEDRAQSV